MPRHTETTYMSRDRDSSGSDADNRDNIESIDDAFSVLKDETRLEILLELTEVASEQGIGEGLTFSELRDRVDVKDSGRFNYHLNKLRGDFVAKLDDKYVARYPSLAVISAMYAGVYRDADEGEPRIAETDIECDICSRPLEVRYGEQEVFSAIWMYCEEHGRMDLYPVPPGAYTNRSLEELMNVAYTRLLTNLNLARCGICLQCWGQMSVEYPVDIESTEQQELMPDDFIPLKIGCDRCWNQFSPIPLRTLIVTHPIVMGMFAERGYSPFEAGFKMTRTGESSMSETEIKGTDPVSATLSVEFDDEKLVLTIDEDCNVVEYHRN